MDSTIQLFNYWRPDVQVSSGLNFTMPGGPLILFFKTDHPIQRMSAHMQEKMNWQTPTNKIINVVIFRCWVYRILLLSSFLH